MVINDDHFRAEIFARNPHNYAPCGKMIALCSAGILPALLNFLDLRKITR